MPAMGRHDHDDDPGGELDLDAVEQQATQVRRRALDLDFGEVFPHDRGPGASPGRRQGEGGLDADAFLSKKEKEARARAGGATPTLDRMGRRSFGSLGGDGVRMDTTLNVTRRGLPTWVLITAFAVVALAGLGGGGYWMYRRHQRQVAAEEAAIHQATQQAREAEEARERGM